MEGAKADHERPLIYGKWDRKGLGKLDATVVHERVPFTQGDILGIRSLASRSQEPGW